MYDRAKGNHCPIPFNTVSVTKARSVFFGQRGSLRYSFAVEGGTVCTEGTNYNADI
jgi:hypothetical protein